ncbi:cyanate lyase C-terminal domain-containing protein [Mrakia frigida]|uniref:cyanase n=1 Tax=Mrakia frigida TaxID=29902 RepID=UPI003FCC221A
MSHLANLPPICKQILAAKAKKGLTFADLALAMGREEVWVGALAYGQAKPTSEDLQKLSAVLGWSDEESASLTAPGEGLGEEFMPVRGQDWEGIPRDPLLYRLYEVLVVFGMPIKHIIFEKFGDGIMSAIDFSCKVEKVPNPKGDRVKITLDGKFLPYSKF